MFFGRTRARNELREALAGQAARGGVFLIVFGASGSGKSSVVKAGLLPDFILPGMVDRVGICRYGVMRPADAPDDLLRGIAEPLLSETSLPVLNELQWTSETLKSQLRQVSGNNDAESDALSVNQGLAKAGQ